MGWNQTDLDRARSETAQAVAALFTIQQTARRLHASATDLAEVTAAIFTIAAEREDYRRASQAARRGTPLPDEDKLLVRRLIASGLDNTAIAEEVGCSIHHVIGIRSAVQRAADRTAATSA